MSILFFCEIPLLLYLSSLYPNPPSVCLQAFLRILVTSTLCCRWWKRPVTVKLLFRSHFPINTVDKVGAGHSMWRRKLFFRRNFLPFFLAFTATSSPDHKTLQDSPYFNSASILKWVKSLGCVYLLGCGLSNLTPSPILLGPQTLDPSQVQ